MTENKVKRRARTCLPLKDHTAAKRLNATRRTDEVAKTTSLLLLYVY